MGTHLKMPVGITSYKKIIDGGYAYVDKTWALSLAADLPCLATLFQVPERFGRTLFLSMLRTFFEDERDARGEKIDNRRYFAGKKIESDEECMEFCGKYPVIDVSFAGTGADTLEEALENVRAVIRGEFVRHAYVLASDRLDKWTRERYTALMDGTADDVFYSLALAFLSRVLKDVSGQYVMVLADGYDEAIIRSWRLGYYDRFYSFLFSLFNSVFKDNVALACGVMAGSFMIENDCDLTGINLISQTPVRYDMDGWFGFTLDETRDFLRLAGMEERLDEVRLWYGGYNFGGIEMFNPDSVVRYVADHLKDPSAPPAVYAGDTIASRLLLPQIKDPDGIAGHLLGGVLEGGGYRPAGVEHLTHQDAAKDSGWHLVDALCLTGGLSMQGTPKGEYYDEYIFRVTDREMASLIGAAIDGPGARSGGNRC